MNSEETQWDSTFSVALGPRDSVKFYANGNNHEVLLKRALTPCSQSIYLILNEFG